MNDYQFIKEFTNITVASICKKLGIRSCNVFNGQTTDENYRKVKFIQDRKPCCEAYGVLDTIKEHISLIDFLTDPNVIVICDGDEYNNWYTLKKLNNRICMIMGGRIAEQLCLDDITAGASSDIGASLSDFEVRAKMHFNSYGINGDPTNPQYIDGATNLNNVEYFYKVVAPSVPIKSSNDKNGTIVGSYNKGDYVFPLDPYASLINGFIQVEEGWCEVAYLKKYISDTSVTDAVMNVVVIAEEVELLSRPSDDSSESILLATIPYETPLRVHRYTDNGYYKLYIPYNGKVGYVDESKTTTYSAEVNYPEDEIIVSDDNKTGICEVYGYSSAGKKLFKLCLSDENEYYSFVTPTLYVGDNKVLEDITTVSSNSGNDIDEYNVAYDALSESTCDWNNFFGELGIRRVNNQWQAWIYKIENGIPVKKLTLKEQEISDAPIDDLRYISIFIGTQDSNNMCGMSITDIQVYRINEATIPAGCNVAPFNPGDEIKIDCYNSKVYLNNKPYNDIDINSQFIELLTGNNILKATSDKPDMLVTVLYNERYL